MIIFNKEKNFKDLQILGFKENSGLRNDFHHFVSNKEFDEDCFSYTFDSKLGCSSIDLRVVDGKTLVTNTANDGDEGCSTCGYGGEDAYLDLDCLIVFSKLMSEGFLLEVNDE